MWALAPKSRWPEGSTRPERQLTGQTIAVLVLRNVEAMQPEC